MEWETIQNTHLLRCPCCVCTEWKKIIEKAKQEMIWYEKMHKTDEEKRLATQAENRELKEEVKDLRELIGRMQCQPTS
jgi:hypothetical protein